MAPIPIIIVITRRVYVKKRIGILFFISSLFTFTKLGAEFIPRLDEGSILLELGRLPSTALQESVDSSLKIEKALKKEIKEKRKMGHLTTLIS